MFYTLFSSIILTFFGLSKLYQKVYKQIVLNVKKHIIILTKLMAYASNQYVYPAVIPMILKT